MRELRKGVVELTLLLTISDEALGGVEILEMAEHGDRLSLRPGSIYPALARLEREKYILGEWVTIAGRRRKIYQLTEEGTERLRQGIIDWQQISECVDSLIETRVKEAPWIVEQATSP